jgi:hypothetical protein
LTAQQRAERVACKACRIAEEFSNNPGKRKKKERIQEGREVGRTNKREQHALPSGWLHP